MSSFLFKIKTPPNKDGAFAANQIKYYKILKMKTRKNCLID